MLLQIAIEKENTLLQTFRTYGNPPFRVAVVHGGPGAAGDVAPVARKLGESRGVLEPFQTATTLDGQIEELRQVLEQNATPPLVLIGHSWGAWLSALVAAKYPALVRKLILVGSGPFEEKYVPSIAENRLKRLTLEEQKEFLHLAEMLNTATTTDNSVSLARLGELGQKSDSYDPIDMPEDLPPPGLAGIDAGQIYQGVWPEAARLRATGELLKLAATITCPVVAIHGDCDPHPAAGVQEPLAANLKDFRMIILEQCGHTPWRERYAMDEVLRQLLERELQSM